MKKNELNDYRSKSLDELRVLRQEWKKEIEKLSLYKTVKKIKNVREIFMKKKDYARLESLIREKELLNG